MKKFIFVLSLVLLVLLLLPFILRIKDVRCSSQYGRCSPNIEEATDQIVGSTYKELDKNISNIEVLNTQVVKYSYYFVPPNMLHINLIEKKGEVAYQILNSSEYHIFSEDVTLINKTSSTQLPVVYIDSEEYLSKHNINFINQFMISLNNYYSIQEAIWSKNSFTIVYNGNTEIIFPTDGDIDVLLGSLEVMLFQLNSALQNSKIEDVEADQISTIDLRYKNPIIK